MLSGVIFGFTAALLQSLSYIFSRFFISRHKNAFVLSVCSQIWMGLLGAAVWLGTLPFVSYPLSFRYVLFAGAWAITFIFAQTSFFTALKTVEASRLSSLLGLKLIALALLALIFTGEKLSGLRWSAVLLCSLSAVGMNFTGGRLNIKSLFWIFLTVLNFALCDLSCTEVVRSMPGSSMLLNSVGATSVCYFVLGIFTIPVLPAAKPARCHWKDSFVYSLIWFSSIIFLLAAFGSLGVIYASIIQSARGLFSVLLGLGLLQTRWNFLEIRVSARAWVRRVIMALLMMLAMVLYMLPAHKG